MRRGVWGRVRDGVRYGERVEGVVTGGGRGGGR